MTYVYVWEYRVRPERVAEFLREYGSAGGWVALFRQAAGYRSTELYRDRDDPHRFLTVDTWESEQAHREFRHRFADALARLDAACEALTLVETPLGRFDRVGE